ncbi:hypothetical protein QRD43_20980 [Pelomonas sp. APW6]|uniref:Uncharacterized protein n=1 Tax=Roseateles subflavus TaxID=3053353 RepID=A0ABT7LQI5_9BURK|nr:hypothetical protein [Pelomonas sp. APW6]MDL5034390.1 hypothetical protein [Pelomonas sp. APW6]
MNATVSKGRGKTAVKPPRGAQYRASEAFQAVINDHSTPVDWIAQPDPERRPLTGHDVEQFRVRNQLSFNTAADALAFVTPFHFKKHAGTSGPLKIEFELLLRIYARHPRPAPWVVVTPKQMFERFYGQLADEFGDVSKKPAKAMLYSRFGALFGRYADAVRRWVESNGKAERVTLRAMEKLSELENPRALAEELARQIYGLRGLDFDHEFPLPDLKNPPIPGKRGPTKGRKAAADDAVIKKIIKRKAGGVDEKASVNPAAKSPSVKKTTKAPAVKKVAKSPNPKTKT